MTNCGTHIDTFNKCLHEVTVAPNTIGRCRQPAIIRVHVRYADGTITNHPRCAQHTNTVSAAITTRICAL